MKMHLFIRKREVFRAHHRSGFLLLTAILISTVVLSVGISMASIAYKELTLSITARDSMYAFYAADAGAECASYWDIRGSDVFPVDDDISYVLPGPTYCNAQDITQGRDGVATWSLAPQSSNPSRTGGQTTGSASTQFTFRLGASQLQSDPCVDVTVKKVWTDNPSTPGGESEKIDPGEVKTTITSNGFSSCDAGNLRRVQRTLEQTY